MPPYPRQLPSQGHFSEPILDCLVGRINVFFSHAKFLLLRLPKAFAAPAGAVDEDAAAGVPAAATAPAEALELVRMRFAFGLGGLEVAPPSPPGVAAGGALLRGGDEARFIAFCSLVLLFLGCPSWLTDLVANGCAGWRE